MTECLPWDVSDEPSEPCNCSHRHQLGCRPSSLQDDLINKEGTDCLLAIEVFEVQYPDIYGQYWQRLPEWQLSCQPCVEQAQLILPAGGQCNVCCT